MSDARSLRKSPFEGGGVATRDPLPLQLKRSGTFIARAPYAWIEMAAPGGGSGTSHLTTIGSGGAGAGQSYIGLVRFVVGKQYTYTKGAIGAGAPYDAGAPGVGTRDGSAGGDSILSGPGVYIRLKGGSKGFGNGAVSTAVGIPASSPAITVSALGGTTYPGTAGGKANTSAVGDPGIASDIQSPATAGVGSPSGGGGGSTPFGTGGFGASSGVAGNSPVVTDSGAGAGGGGAGDATRGPGGADGADGRFIAWWQG